MKMRLRFLGGAGTVTGSKYLLNVGGRRVLVDCGLFQGLKELRIKNWDRFPVDPREIAAIVLTHAHIDHSGYIPRLVKEGFRGKIFCTPATKDVARLLLLDTGFLQEEEAEYLNRKHATKHAPALPLFSREDAENSLRYFAAREFNEEFQVVEGLKARFAYAGHILGAASVVLRNGETSVGFSGDVGRPADPLFFPPQPMADVDYLVVESTYGNRKHPDSDPKADLERIVNETFSRGGIVMIPAFAVGRAQTLMYLLSELRDSGRIPKEMPLFLNSPLAENVTGTFYRYAKLHKLSRETCQRMQANFRVISSAEESRKLNENHDPKVIVSASGMATGGRILHHLRAFAGDPNSTIVLAGFQAAGTRGRALQEGAKEIRIHGSQVEVGAQVVTIENLSAHGDYAEILSWLEASKLKPKAVYVTHGEPEAAAAMSDHLSEAFGWKCEVARSDLEVTLSP